MGDRGRSVERRDGQGAIGGWCTTRVRAITFIQIQTVFAIRATDGIDFAVLERPDFSAFYIRLLARPPASPLVSALLDAEFRCGRVDVTVASRAFVPESGIRRGIRRCEKDARGRPSSRNVELMGAFTELEKEADSRCVGVRRFTEPKYIFLQACVASFG